MRGLLASGRPPKWHLARANCPENSGRQRALSVLSCSTPCIGGALNGGATPVFELPRLERWCCTIQGLAAGDLGCSGWPHSMEAWPSDPEAALFACQGLEKEYLLWKIACPFNTSVCWPRRCVGVAQQLSLKWRNLAKLGATISREIQNWRLGVGRTSARPDRHWSTSHSFSSKSEPGRTRFGSNSRPAGVPHFRRDDWDWCRWGLSRSNVDDLDTTTNAE